MNQDQEIRDVPRWRVVFVRTIIHILFKLFTRREIHGVENIPCNGACLLVFNHLSNFDPPLIFTRIHRRKATGIVAASYKTHLFYRFVIEWAGGMWIRRGARDRAALRTAETRLNNGWFVGLAPEGGRSKAATLQQGRTGAAWLATRTQAPVIPVAVTQTQHIAAGLKRFRRTSVTVRIGEPFLLPPSTGEGQKRYLESCTDLLMCQIAALLPPEYRGEYAFHPQLLALVAGEDTNAGHVTQKTDSAPVPPVTIHGWSSE
jgi:1-acyl-sn-glycerol-3-phosphate acyltransferase